MVARREALRVLGRVFHSREGVRRWMPRDCGRADSESHPEPRHNELSGLTISRGWSAERIRAACGDALVAQISRERLWRRATPFQGRIYLVPLEPGLLFENS